MEEYYSEPNEELKSRRFAGYRDRYINPLFPDNKNAYILDLACGYGLFLDACKKLGFRNQEGVEQGIKFVNYAKTKLKLKNITRGDLVNFLEKKTNESYDVITALNIIEHIRRDRIPYVLKLINKKTKSGGLFIMEVPNADSPLGVHTYFSDLTHEFAFSRKLAVKLLRLSGFKDIKVMYEPMRKNPLIKIAQKILAKTVGFEYQMMFSGNIVVVGYKK